MVISRRDESGQVSSHEIVITRLVKSKDETVITRLVKSKDETVITRLVKNQLGKTESLPPGQTKKTGKICSQIKKTKYYSSCEIKDETVDYRFVNPEIKRRDRITRLVKKRRDSELVSDQRETFSSREIKRRDSDYSSREIKRRDSDYSSREIKRRDSDYSSREIKRRDSDYSSREIKRRDSDYSSREIKRRDSDYSSREIKRRDNDYSSRETNRERDRASLTSIGSILVDYKTFYFTIDSL
ncbi:hypothetical protein WDU94_002794 [Cyamophila willieti]